jgi:hypothetical protein
MEDIHLPTLAWLWDEDWHIEMDFKAGFQFYFAKCFDLASATHCSLRSFSGKSRAFLQTAGLFRKKQLLILDWQIGQVLVVL